MSICINPVVNYIEQIIAISENQSISISQAFFENSFLPITASGICELGCEDLYIIAPFRLLNGNNPLQYLKEECGYIFEGTCCLNYELQSFQDYNVINNINIMFDTKELLTCCNSFNKCTGDFYELITAEYWVNPDMGETYFENGIVEYNTLNGDSGICDLLTFLKTLPTSTITFDVLQDVIDQFMAVGFLVYYDVGTTTLYAGSIDGLCNFIK